MNKHIPVWLVLGMMVPFLGGTDKLPLAARWKAWLNEEVAHIIAPKEKDVFLALKSDKERETFVEAFWLQRDPTPGTPDNEFKTEHFRRLKYADDVYGRSSMKRGRDTDRGRIYIQLGEPISIERFEEGAQQLNSCELWHYQGDTALGLPPFFYMLFFKKDAMSEFKIYSPSFDGPASLIQKSFQSSLDRQGAYEQIQKASAELAEASLTLIPGTAGDVSSTVSSLSSDFLISGIAALPEKKVQSAWAAAFAKNSEIITTDHSVNYLPANAALFVHQEGGLNVLHAVFEPSRLSMAQYEDKVYAALKLNIKMAKPDGAVVHQEEKNVPIEIGKDDFAGIARRIVAVGDILPVIEGTYVLNYLLRNPESKEFSSLEETVKSPSPGEPSLSPILVLYDAKPVPRDTAVAPFIFDGMKIFPDTTKTLPQGNALQVYFEIYNPNESTGAGALRMTVDDETENVLRVEEAVAGRRYFIKKLGETGFRPGYYLLTVSVSDASGREILSARERFSVSAASAVPKPWRFDKRYPPLAHPYYAMILAYEYLGLGDPARAVSAVEPIHDKNAPNLAVSLLLAKANFEMKKDAEVAALMEPFREGEESEAHLLLGKSLYRLGRYADALPVLEKALNSIGQTVELLNLVGTSCLKTGRQEQGLPYLVRSLEMNPDQPEIRKAVDEAKAR